MLQIVNLHTHTTSTSTLLNTYSHKFCCLINQPKSLMFPPFVLLSYCCNEHPWCSNIGQIKSQCTMHDFDTFAEHSSWGVDRAGTQLLVGARVWSKWELEITRASLSLIAALRSVHCKSSIELMSLPSIARCRRSRETRAAQREPKNCSRFNSLILWSADYIGYEEN